jgi:molybdate/tungstate transport system permease protein
VDFREVVPEAAQENAGLEANRRAMLLWRAATVLFAIALLYPLAGLLVPVGAWRWGDSSTLDAVRVSLVLTSVAMIVVIALGTPMALAIARSAARARLVWQAILLVSVLVPPLALGILISLAFGPHALGAYFDRVGLKMTNTPLAFVVTQVYVSIGYYILAAVAAIEAVPAELRVQAGLLGANRWNTFWRVTFPIARLGLTVAVSLAWVRALTEFGAVVVTAYYPAGMPVAIWTGLENFGLPAVMPLLVVFLLTALPLPWLAHVFAQRRIARA